MKPLAERIAEIIRPSLEAMGFDLVQVQVMDGKKRKTLQVFAENRETGRITLDECAQASRTISTLLDVEDVMEGAYNLEVSSPGIDRPLTRPADYERHLGFDVKVETRLPIQGRRRFKGQLIAAQPDQITIRIDGEDHRLNLADIATARPVLTDAFIKAHRAQQDKQAEQKENTHEFSE